MMEEKRTRRVLTREFKAEAVELLINGGKTAVEVARNLGIRVELLHRWKNEYMSNRAEAFPGMGHLAYPEEERMRKLERELASVTEERDILKKGLSHPVRCFFIWPRIGEEVAPTLDNAPDQPERSGDLWSVATCILPPLLVNNSRYRQAAWGFLSRNFGIVECCSVMHGRGPKWAHIPFAAINIY